MVRKPKRVERGAKVPRKVVEEKPQIDRKPPVVQPESGTVIVDEVVQI